MRCLLIVALIALLGLSPTGAQQVELIELTDPVAILGDENRGSLLSGPSDVVAGNGDTLYALDNRDLVIVAFRRDGTELFRFGRAGEGPGEFSQPQAIAFTGRSLLVSDYRLTRIQEFTTTGRLERAIRLASQPRLGMVAHERDLYVGVQSSQALILRLPLDDPDRAEPFLTFAHPEFAGWSPRDQFTKGGVVLGTSSTGLLVAFPALGKFCVIPWSSDPDKASLIAPDCDLLAIEWKRMEELQARTGGAAGAQMFNTISPWSEGSVLLEVRTGMAQTFRAIAIVVDARTGQELGPRISPAERGYGGLRLLKDDLIAWIHWQVSGVSLFTFAHP
jgi:hypothetical protein